MVRSDDGAEAQRGGNDDEGDPLWNTPDSEAIDEPSLDREQEASENAWMTKEITSIGAISILFALLLAVVLMQSTGLVDFLSPLADTEPGQWVAVAGLGLVFVVIFLWSRRGV